MKGVLTKVGTSKNNNLRTPTVEGEFPEYPTEGMCFTILGKSLTEGMDCRWVRTSTVQKVTQSGNTYSFHTLNSTYILEAM